MTFADQSGRSHADWLGMAQPEGLVVTPATLKAVDANVTWPVAELQATLRELAGPAPHLVRDLSAFLREVLGWSDDLVVRGDVIPDALRVRVDGADVLAPSHAVRSADDEGAFVLLVGEASPAGADLDAATDDARWTASAHQRFERLLGKRVSSRQPGVIPRGSLYLQPGEDRRKTGSHYTPKSLTAPIVETTLRPILERFGPEPRPEQILDLAVCDPAMGSGAFLVEACRQLAEHLVTAWRRVERLPTLPPDEDLVLHARRLVAQRCLYGVDKNPLAVDLARLSMWLVTFAREHPFTFVDHALRCGDSLVGLSKEQLANLSLHVEGGFTQIEMVRPIVAEAVGVARRLRDEIHAMGDPPDNDRLVQLWKETNDALDRSRLLADVVVAAYFSSDTEKVRKKALEGVREMVRAWLASGRHEAEIRGMAADVRSGERGVTPFHWEIEFPEVFGRENAGFDVFVGNPPFLGGTVIGTRLGLSYHDFVVETCTHATGNVDLVVFFLRRAFSMLRRGGAFGLIATNSVSQGDTRVAGLETICAEGGVVYDARRRYAWPGMAAVVVSILHVSNGQPGSAVHLDGEVVDRISAFLLPGVVDRAPDRLRENAGLAYVGREIRGAGFVFESSPADGSSSLDDMRAILSRVPNCREVIFPYLGAEEFNSSPTQSPSRFVIDFGERREEECEAWAPLLNIVRERVRPIRLVNKQRNYREDWWLHATRVPEAGRYLSAHGRVIALAQVSKHLAAAFVSNQAVLAKTLVLILRHDAGSLAVIQSTLHDGWVRFLGSSLKDWMRYTPTDCLDPFPFPSAAGREGISSVASEYFGLRSVVMGANGEGLTRTYNRFHDADERSAAIANLRDLHGAMDRAVLDAYGWTDIQPVYDFREQLDESIRFTWAEETRDEVLARLLELNRVRAAHEAEAAAAARPPPRPRGGRRTATRDEATLNLPISGHAGKER